jgi:hypothetical protein
MTEHKIIKATNKDICTLFTFALYAFVPYKLVPVLII